MEPEIQTSSKNKKKKRIARDLASSDLSKYKVPFRNVHISKNTSNPLHKQKKCDRKKEKIAILAQK